MDAIKLWKDSYRTGSDEIDSQHQELFHQVEDFLTIAMTAGETANKQKCMETLDFLLSYTARHFELEETLQRERDYVGYAEHVKLHERFKNTVLAYQETVEREFSQAMLKRLAGTLMTWLTIHVCDCDRKIFTNEPISPQIHFEGVEDLIRTVTTRLLSDTYGIVFQNATASVYNGCVDGKVIVRSMIGNQGKTHVFLIGFSEEMARALYRGISGVEIGSMDAMNAVEKSALMELGDIIASHVLAYLISDEGGNQFDWRGDLFLDQYRDTGVDIKNNMCLKFDTDHGALSVMYCAAG